MQKQSLVHTERILKALANRRRLALISILKKGKPMTVSCLAEEIKLSVRSTSKHLAVLSAAQILSRSQQSLNMYYSVSQDFPNIARHIISTL